MNYAHSLPLHREHSTMTCSCPACLLHKNAETVISAKHAPTVMMLSRVQQTQLTTELVHLTVETLDIVDTETGESGIYDYPVVVRLQTGLELESR